jgi:hypothetical protein
MDFFADAIRALPYRALLILDTCEELAKTRPDGTVPHSVGYTFALLELLHEKLPSLRVLFSGRRPLASRGFNWSCAQRDLPERHYLLLHEVRGFTEPEAHAFLGQSLKVSDELIPSILLKSPDPGPVIRAIWEGVSEDESNTKRYNPYELKLFGDWALEDPPPPPSLIADCSHDFYIEHRIIRRLRFPQLERLLPVLAAVGHFDGTLLRVLSNALTEEVDVLCSELRQQEWINVRFLANPDIHQSPSAPATTAEMYDCRIIYSLEPRMRRRFLQYFSNETVQNKEDVETAVRHLMTATLRRDLGSLDWTHFDAVIALLKDQPVRAAEWWLNVEERLLSTGARAFTWMLSLTEWLKGPEFDEYGLPTRELALTAAIWATLAAAQIQTGSRGDLPSTWRIVLQSVDRYPVPEGRARLRLRAIAGLIAAEGRDRIDFNLLEELDVCDLDSSSDFEEIAISLLAAVEAVLEWLEAVRMGNQSGSIRFSGRAHDAYDLIPTPDPDKEPPSKQFLAEIHKVVYRLAHWVVSSLVNMESPAVPFALCLMGRAHFHPRRSLDLVVKALDNVEKAGLVRSYLDWVVPAEFSARIALEFVRHAIRAGVRPTEIVNRVGGMSRIVPAEADLDAATFGAALAFLKLSGTAAEMPHGEEPTHTLHTHPHVQRNVHNAFPSPLEIHAESLSSNGRPEDALTFVRPLVNESSSFDEAARRCAERAYLRIVRRWRLSELGEGRVDSLLNSDDPHDHAIRWAVAALSGESRATGMTIQSPDLERHLAYQSSLIRVWSEEAIRHSNELTRLYWKIKDRSVFLDLVELEIIRKHGSTAESSLVSDDVVNFSLAHPNIADQKADFGINFPGNAFPLGFEDSHPREMLVRWALRSLALLGEDIANSPVVLCRLSEMGIRRVADIAMEEGELLFLRLPKLAPRLVAFGADMYLRANDNVSAFLAFISLAIFVGPIEAGEKVSTQVLQNTYTCVRNQLGWAGSVLPAWDDILYALEAGNTASLAFPKAWGAISYRLLLVLAHRHGASAPNVIRDLRERAPLTPPNGSEITVPPELLQWLPSGDSSKLSPTTVRHSWSTHAIQVGVAAGLVICVFPAYFALLLAYGWKLGVEVYFSKARLALLICPAITVVAFGLTKAPRRAKTTRLALLILIWAVTNLGCFYGAAVFLTDELAWTRIDRVAGGLCVMVFGALMLFSYRYTRASLARNERLLIDVTLTGITRDHYLVRLKLWPPPPFLQPMLAKKAFSRGAATFDLMLSRTGEYKDLCQESPAILVAVLQRANLAFENVGIQSELRFATPEAHEIPLEAALFFLSGPKVFARPGDQAFRWYRGLHGHRTREKLRSETGAVIVASNGPFGAYLKRSCWPKSRRACRSFGDMDRELDFRNEGTADILHLIGTPQDDVGGLRFRLESEPRFSEGNKPHLLQAEQIAASFPSLRLCVLQNEPRPLAERRESDRRVAALSRRFASRVFAMATFPVIVIPPLDVFNAERAVAILARACGTNRFARADLLKIAKDLRALAAWSGDGKAREGSYKASVMVTKQEMHKDCVEVSLDVICFTG